jgi:signal peptidase
MNDTAKRIWNIVSGILVGIVVLLAVVIAGPRLIGYQPYAVLSGSMEPTYHVGSLIYVKPCDASEVAAGDPITFVFNEDLVVATHRVVRIDEANQRFYTKGDANDAEDGSPVHFNNLIGKPAFTLLYLGYVSTFLETTKGKIIGITVVVTLLLLAFLPDILSFAEKKGKKEDDKADDKAEEDQPNSRRYNRIDQYGRAGRTTHPDVQYPANEEAQK